MDGNQCFNLIQKASKNGGDKYQCGDFIIYLPQTISRVGGQVQQTVWILVTTCPAWYKETERECESGFNLVQKASKNGGDKYQKGNFTIYLPQNISRKYGPPEEKIWIIVTTKQSRYIKSVD